MAQRLELWPVSRLQSFASNARSHPSTQIAALAASITEFGFCNPILVDGKDGIVAGHGRLAAAELLGLTEVPVVVLDHLTTDQRRAYLLADNRLAEQAAWNTEALASELEALAESFDLETLGFTAADLARASDAIATPLPRPLTAPSGLTEQAEPEPMPAATSEPLLDASVSDRVTFSVSVTWEDREALMAAIAAAQRRWSLDTLADGLMAIAHDWLQDANS